LKRAEEAKRDLRQLTRSDHPMKFARYLKGDSLNAYEKRIEKGKETARESISQLSDAENVQDNLVADRGLVRRTGSAPGGGRVKDPDEKQYSLHLAPRHSEVSERRAELERQIEQFKRQLAGEEPLQLPEFGKEAPAATAPPPPEEEKKRLKDFLDRVTAGIEAEETSAELNMQAEETGIDDLTMQIDNSSEITTLRFDEYQEADPLTLEMAEGSSDEAYWLAQVQYILEVEQPVHKKEVYRRMCPALDAAKVTAVVKHITDQCLDHLIEEEIAEERGEFLYLKGAEKINPRRPAEGTEAREIDLIAQEEIQAGFLAILKYSLGLTREELLRECTRQFGYAQSGPRIKIRLEEVLDDMLARADVKESDGRLYLTEEEA
jgi:hypothetical protein